MLGKKAKTKIVDLIEDLYDFNWYFCYQKDYTNNKNKIKD
jgi:hypothetical protein